MSELKFGIIGAGAISHACAAQINGHPKATVVAAADPSTDRLAELVKKNDIARSYSSSDELLTDKDVEAVYIAVPNKFHAPMAKAALEAGKHVILDKPFAFSYAEAVEVAEAAKKSGKTFTLGMNQRFASNAQKAKSITSSGYIGDVYHAKAYWMRRAGIPKLGTWFGIKDVAGGGALLDIGVHHLDLALYLLDNFDVESVSGATYSIFGHRGLGEGSWGMSDRGEFKFDVDDFATALIKLKGGATLSLDVSWAIHQKDSSRNDVQIFGSEGGVTVHPLETFRYGEKKGEYIISQSPEADILYPHCNRFTNFINAVFGEEELCTTVEQALAVQRILDGIYESCKTGREVRFDG